MTKLLLIRHGESETNRTRTFTGQLDAALLDNGIIQAELTADFIAKNYNVSAVYASDLERTYQTGEIVAKACNAELFKDSRLREIYAKVWQGMTYADIAKNYQEDYSFWLTDIGNCRATDGESVAELAERVQACLTDIAKKHDGETVAIATHATPIRAMECIWRGLTLDEMKNIPWVSNASVTEVCFENGEWTLTKIGEDSHLAEVKTVFAKGV